MQYIVKSISLYISVCAWSGGGGRAVFSRSVLSNSWHHGLEAARLLCPWGFPRQEHWSGLPFPPPGDLLDPEIKPASPALADGFFTTESFGKPSVIHVCIYMCIHIYICIMKYMELSRSILILYLIKYSTKVIVFYFYARSNSWIYYLTVNTCLSIHICVNSTCSSAFRVFCSVPCNVRESILTLASGNLNFTPFLPSHDFK